MLKKLVVVGVLALALSACSTQTFVLHGPDSSMPKTDTQQSFFVYGLGQEQITQAAQVCGGAANVAKVQVQQTFVNILLSAVTFGIYTPRQARVYCTK